MAQVKYLDKNGTFRVDDVELQSGLYFPLASEKGLKTAITPTLHGDAKLSQNQFLFAPASIENLNNDRSCRNFWLDIEGKGLWSAVGNSALQQAYKMSKNPEVLSVEAGFMWHKVERDSKEYGIKAVTTSFVPVEENVEIHQFTFQNVTDKEIVFTPIAAFSIYGRSADNLRDHRHVTSLLHRIETKEKGVEVNPTLTFDERGHQLNDTKYFVYGMDEKGNAPKEFYPVLDDFIGLGGNLEAPMALINKHSGVPSGTVINGQEAMGGLSFEQVTLQPGDSINYYVFAGMCPVEDSVEAIVNQFGKKEDIEQLLEQTKSYWNQKVNVEYQTGNPDFDHFMKWVSFQPELRRIFGCSFLPHHDYGKGGRGWRDLWQDCLALLLMNPDSVRQLLKSNFKGVRIDGTNATIIGSQPGEFKADRNGITRVWMDHGLWPFITTKLYVEQTGDFEFLLEENDYFKDRQIHRGEKIDALWTEDIVNQKTQEGQSYTGTILEHLILQNLAAFWEVGEHGFIRLRDADWNDAIDMAGERGESVAFTNVYGKNLIDLGTLLINLSKKGITTISLFEEMDILLTACDLFATPAEKNQVLDTYLSNVSHTISGKKKAYEILELAENLKTKGTDLMEQIRQTQWVKDDKGNGWYNGYYDNDGNALEGFHDGKADMMLTSQVFSIMSGTATEEQIPFITASADKYLFDEKCGGYRLNTDFKEVKTNMGRMFGFAYGEKENGAVFSHMAVMYANALYSRGFAREGYKSLYALYKQSAHFDKSGIFPGVPEYFGRGGRGLYHYLTGAASWYMLTVMNEMFGIKGKDGVLVFEPKLLKEQFDKNGEASISFVFAGKSYKVTYQNKEYLDYGQYKVLSVNTEGNNIYVTLGA